MGKKQGNLPNADSQTGEGPWRGRGGGSPGDTPRAAHPIPTSLVPQSTGETRPGSTAVGVRLGRNHRVCFHAKTLPKQLTAAQEPAWGARGLRGKRAETQRVAGGASTPALPWGQSSAVPQRAPRGSPGAQSPPSPRAALQPAPLTGSTKPSSYPEPPALLRRSRGAGLGEQQGGGRTPAGAQEGALPRRSPCKAVGDSGRCSVAGQCRGPSSAPPPLHSTGSRQGR